MRHAGNVALLCCTVCLRCVRVKFSCNLQTIFVCTTRLWVVCICWVSIDTDRHTSRHAYDAVTGHNHAARLLHIPVMGTLYSTWCCTLLYLQMRQTSWVMH